MATETQFPNSASGWSTGLVTDIDEGIASPDGNIMSSPADGEGVALTLGLDATTIDDADTVTRVDIKVRCKVDVAVSDTMDVELLIGGVPQGTTQATGTLTASHQDFTLNHTGWNSDWTAAQLNGAEIRLTGRQAGMPTAVRFDVDTAEALITYSEAAGGPPHIVYKRRGTRAMKTLLTM